jgi:hypothetical protein
MNFSFCISTTPITHQFLPQIIHSIEELKIPNYEILVCGTNITASIPNAVFINVPLNSTFTFKKNTMTNMAKYENLVFLHDYIAFNDNWYGGFIKFNEEVNGNWEIAMCKIKNIDGTRGIDWMGLPNDTKYGNVLFPYEYSNPKGMYVPGNFWVAKKSIMIKYPLDIHLNWGQGEDIEWSKRVLGGLIEAPWLRNICRVPMGVSIDESHCTSKYKMNPYSLVSYLKNKPTHPDFLKEYDDHSGDNSRPIGYKREDYEYMIQTERFK